MKGIAVMPYIETKCDHCEEKNMQPLTFRDTFSLTSIPEKISLEKKVPKGRR
jgi:hypothetical protein